MSGWIKFWKDMPNDPRVVSAAMKLANRYVLARRTPAGGNDLSTSDMCNAWRNAVTGALVTLWVYADEHIRDDDTLQIDSQTLDAIVGLEGFFEVMPREWIDELEDGCIVLPGYCQKNSLIAKRKRTATSNARVTRWRRAKKANGNGVTNHHVTQCNAAGDLDQDLDSKNKKRNGAHAPGFVSSTEEPPEGLNLEAWSQWQAYRKLKPKSIPAAQRKLARFGPTQAEVVEHSIAGGYDGLFAPPKFSPAQISRAEKDMRAEREQRQLAELKSRAERIGFRAFTEQDDLLGYKTLLERFESNQPRRASQ
jgi:hypothetical protein